MDSQSSNPHSKPPGIRKASGVGRYALSAFLILVSAVALHQLSGRLIAQAHYHIAENFFLDGHYGLAAAQLEKARKYSQDDFDIQQTSGQVFSRLARVRQPTKTSFHFAKAAKSHYVNASRLNPLDAHVFYGLAGAEARLQQLHRLLNPDSKGKQYNPLPYFKESLRLRPNSVLYRYAMARYLHREGKTEDLPRVIQTLARIYPPSYYDLKKESFWSPAVREACEKGLMEAVSDKTSIRETHRALSSLKAEKGNWSVAINHLTQALQDEAFKNKPQDYIPLGRLYLKNGQVKEAEDTFLFALGQSRSKDKDLEQIYRVYGKEGKPGEFYDFCQRAKKQFIFSHKMLLLLARSMIDSGRFNQARRTLRELNNQEPDAETYYFLARLAEKEKDWENVVLSIRKSTLLDPNNSRYHQLFSSVLSRMNKLERAEKEAGLALKHSEKPDPLLFDHRALIRWKQEDYLGAVRDWKRAIRLSPGKHEKASFHARAAEAYIKAGHLPSALKHYRMAFELEPENAGYQQKYEEIKNAS